MASPRNVAQIYAANPITVIDPSTLIYLVQDGTTDAAMLGSVFNALFPSQTGAGASGTWGINITGNAATATSATTAGSATTATNLSGLTALTLYGNTTGATATGQSIALGTGLSFSGSSTIGLAAIPATTLLGNATAGTAIPSTIILGTGLAFFAGSSSLDLADIPAFSLIGNPSNSKGSPGSITLGTGLAFSGTTLNITTIAVANGGTGATTATGAQTNLGLGTAATQTLPTSTTASLFPLTTSTAGILALSPYTMPLAITTGSIFYALNTTTIATLPSPASLRVPLFGNAGGAPTFAPYSFPATLTLNSILYAASTGTVGQIASTSGVLITNAVGSIPFYSTTLPAGLTIPTPNITTGMTLNSGTQLNTYQTGTWTPVFTGLTVVGTATFMGNYVKIGQLVTCVVNVTSTTSTTSAGAGATSFTGLPFVNGANTTINGFNYANNTSLSTGFLNTIASGTGVTPAWPASGAIVLSFSYLATTN